MGNGQPCMFRAKSLIQSKLGDKVPLNSSIEMITINACQPEKTYLRSNLLKMSLKYIIIGILGMAFLLNCSTGKNVTSDRDTVKTQMAKNDYKGQRQLIDHLRTTPGVEVRGGGANLLILVRGAKSMTGNNNPLYVVDGVNMGYDYYAAASAANQFMIEKIVVLPPPRSGRYGSQGQNGVIEVTTRQTN